MPVTSPARRVRLWAIVTVGCLLLSLIGSAGAQPTAAQSASPVDLAALLPGVLDLEDAGVEGLIPSSVNDADTLPHYLAFQTFPDQETYQDRFDALDAAGFVRNFQTWWADEAAISAYRAGRDLVPVTQVRFYATEFANARGAADGFAELESSDTDLDDAAIDLGDETDVSDATADVGASNLEGVDVTVRIGVLNVGVMVRTQEESPVRGDELEVATELIQSYVDRIDSLEALPTDTIGLDGARFLDTSLYTRVNGYLIRDGESVWAYPNEAAEDREALTRDAVDTGITSQYEIRQVLATEEFTDERFGYILDTLVTSYETARRARAAFDTTIDGWEAADYQVTEIDDAPTLGDESVAFEAVDADETEFRSIMVWRDGATIHRVYINLPTRLAEPDALLALIDAQVACLDDGTCWRNQPLPGEIEHDAGPVADDSTPVGGTPTAGDETGTPVAEDDDATPVAADERATYQSDGRGFSLAWDQRIWTRADDYQPFFGVEGLRLDHTEGGALFIEVQESRSARTLSGCVEELSDVVLSEEGVEDVEPAVNVDGDEIAGADDDLAYAAYAITFDGDDGVDYFACATLVEGESALGFIYITNELDTIEEQLADVRAVIDSYDVG